ncbi:hypothetical protein [Nocardioides aquaticus]|nr:hypothetical protein [Nocardioides aquaticus]
MEELVGGGDVEAAAGAAPKSSRAKSSSSTQYDVAVPVRRAPGRSSGAQ